MPPLTLCSVRSQYKASRGLLARKWSKGSHPCIRSGLLIFASNFCPPKLIPFLVSLTTHEPKSASKVKGSSEERKGTAPTNLTFSLDGISKVACGSFADRLLASLHAVTSSAHPSLFARQCQGSYTPSNLCTCRGPSSH